MLGINYFTNFISLIEVLIVLLPMLLGVAFMTIIERKQLAAHQRRIGPTDVGLYGVLQPFTKIKEWHSFVCVLFVYFVCFLINYEK